MRSDHKDIRDSQVQNYFTAMKKTSSYFQRVQIANILGKMYEKNDEYSDGIFTRIYKFISDSNDKEERKIGLIVLPVLGHKMQGSARSAFVNKFHSPVFKLFEINTDQSLIQLIREAYSVILDIGGNQNDSVVESDLSNSLLILKNNTKDVRKMGAYSAIQVLVNTSPYLTFKKLVQKIQDENNDNLSILIHTAKSRNIRVRESYLRFLSDYIQYASQKKDHSFQEHIMSKILDENPTHELTEEQVHLYVETLKIFLRYLRPIFSQQKLQECTLFTLEKIATNKSPIIQKSLIDLIPQIISHQSPLKLVSQVMLYLRSIKQKDEKIAQIAINSILKKFIGSLAELSQQILKPLLSDIIQSLHRLSSRPLSKLTGNSQKQDRNSQNYIFQEEELISQKVQSLSIILMNDQNKQLKPPSSNRITNLYNRHKKLTKTNENNKLLVQDILTADQLNQLASSAMLLSLHKKTLKFINEISKRNIHNLGVILQRKLIILFYKILTGSSPKTLSSSRDLNEELKNFQEKAEKIIVSESEEMKVRAIEALSIFKFKEGLRDYVGGFIKEKVLKKYLEWGNGSMRCAAVEAAFNLYTKKNNTIAENQMMQILDRLIRVGMTDQQEIVREKVFNQLYYNIQKVDNFYNFISHSNLLIHLFQATEDYNQHIRLTSLKCITCLYKKQPSPTIIPFLKKHLHNILLSLKTNFKYHPEKHYLIKSLLMFIEQSPDIIENHVELLLESILGYVEDRKNYEGLEVLFFKAFKVIIENHPHKAILYIGEICKNVVLALSDRLGTKKRSQSLKLLNSLIKSCGYVVIPYFQVPQLMDSLLYLLKSEISNQSRTNILRIIGGFGAIDQQKYHALKAIVQEYQHTKNCEILKMRGFCFNFLRWRMQIMEKKNNNEYQKELVKYSDQMMVIESKSRRLQTANHEDVVKYLVSKFKQKNHNLINLSEQFIRTQSSQQLQKKQKYPSNYAKLSLKNFNLYIIHSLMNIINDTFLKQKIQLALDVLFQIFQILGKELEKDLDVLIPMLIDCQEKQCLNLLIILVRDCNVVAYIDKIIDYAFRTSSSVQSITNLLQIISYNYTKQLRTSASAILTKLHMIIESEPENIKLHVKILMIYRNLNDLLEPYLAELIPLILQKFFTSKNTQATNASIDLLITLTLSCISLAQYLSQIVHKLTNLLKLCANNHSHCKPCLRNKIGNCFVLFLIYYQDQFMVYLPIVHQSMIIAPTKHELYEKSIHYMENCYYGNLKDQFTTEELDKIIPEVRIPMLNRFEIPKYIKKIEGTDELIHEFDVVSKKFIEEDWIEWLRKISVLMIKKSPNIVLRTCSDLAEGYTELAMELFNISFYSLWDILLDNQKKELILHIKSIITTELQPSHILIRKTILNLCEFMNRKKCPLEISNAILSKCATESSAYAKTLYYKEIQFQLAPEDCLENLIETYMKLGQSENANGLLTIAENIGMQCKVEWYEKLSKYEKAYNIYVERLKGLNQGDEKYYQNTLKKLECLRYIDKQKFIDELEENEQFLSANKKNQQDLAILACQCYSNLQEWDKVEQWTGKISAKKHPQENYYFKSLVGIYTNDLDQALVNLNKSRKILYNQISQLIAFSSSTSSFEKIIKAQKLCELEEIIQLMKMEEILEKEEVDDIILENKNCLYHYHNSQLFQSGQTYKLDYEAQYNAKVTKLKNMWSDRLLGCPRTEQIWSKFVALRSLFFNKLQYFQFFSQYCEILLKNKNIHLCEKMLHEFKQEFDQLMKNQQFEKISQAEFSDEMEDIRGKIMADMQMKSEFIQLLDIRINLVDGLKNEEHINEIIEFLASKTHISPAKKSEVYEECAHYLLFSNSRNSDSIADYDNTNIPKVIQILKTSTEIYTSENQLQILGKIYLDHKSQNPVTNIQLALNTYMTLLKISQIDNEYFLQSCLKIFSILLQYSNQYDEVYEEFIRSYKDVPVEVWINVTPQMIAHLHEEENQENPKKNNFVKIIKELFLATGLQHPEAILYGLNFAIRCKIAHRITPALEILDKLKQKHGTLCSEIEMISKELSNAAIKLKQYWFDSIESIWSMYTQNKSSKEIITLLKNLKQQIFSRQNTNSERAFHQQFGLQIKEGYNWLSLYEKSGNLLCLSQAFQIFIQVYMKIKQSFENLKKIYLINVAPNLIDSRNYCSSIPGMFRLKGKQIKISSFQNQLAVLPSKQRPRKLKIFGDDGKQYNFLLKGRQDIRLDERVMQFFGLINKLLEKERQSLKHDLKIERYSIIPLTVNAGLIGWVQNCDTLNELIKEYRTHNKIKLQVEKDIYEKICVQYATLPVLHKLQIFQAAQEMTLGKDLRNVFYYNSSSSEEWVERRNFFTTSLGAMSMVGYIIGLGDRHPSNIMVNRNSGKIVHIDFGDCFEVAVLRQKFPEKVPFRLTRMLRNVMGPVGIHGVYKQTCQNVMRVLRQNKESLLSVLETFVHDPILSWRIIIDRKKNNEQAQNNEAIKQEQQAALKNGKPPQNIIGSIMQGLGEVIQYQKNDRKVNQEGNLRQTPNLKQKYWQSIYPEKINEKAINALVRIQKKLSGTDFKDEQLKVSEQVEKLIAEAVSHENICQSWPGWCPFW